MLPSYPAEHVTASHLHNFGTTPLTVVVFADSSRRGGCFGDIWRKISRKPQSRLWRQAHTNRAAHEDVLTRCVSLFVTSTLFTVLCQCSLFVFPCNCHHKVTAYGTCYMKRASKYWSLSRHGRMLSRSGFIFTAADQSKRGKMTDVFQDTIFMTHTLRSCALHGNHMEVRMVLHDADLSRMVSRWRCGQQTEKGEVNYQVPDKWTDAEKGFYQTILLLLSCHVF